MTKAISSAVDFLQALAGSNEIYEIEGVAVELRSLTFTEAQQIGTKYKDDYNEMALQALTLGLVAPKLDEAQLLQLRNSKPGPLMKIATRVMQISGMAEDSGPLEPGGGS